MSVNPVTGVGLVVQPAASGRPPIESTATSPSRSSRRADALVRVDKLTQQPIPPRFPWLSRLARELEPASRQPVPYPSVPPLGENVDQRA
jgi:hypothetical protein